MCHSQDGEALLLIETSEEVVQSVARVLVEVAGGLVGQEGPGALGEGAGHSHPLLFAAGERARVMIGPLREPQLGEELLPALLGLGVGNPGD